MESTLALQYQDLMGEVGLFLGWGRGAYFGDTAWDTRQQNIIDRTVASGLRQFYYPPPAQGMTGSYDWSFLKPTALLDFPPGVDLIPLPDDFGGFEGPLTLQTTGSTAQPWRIEWRNEGDIRRMYSLTPSQTGPPIYASETPVKGTVATAGQRFQLLIFPVADMDYTLQCQYYIHPDYLSGAFPYAYGGPAHAETILESCLAIAEERLDDVAKGQGPHGIKFMERLLASISMDRRHKPQKIGRNLDRSDDDGRRGNPHDWGWSPNNTYNGSSFD